MNIDKITALKKELELELTQALQDEDKYRQACSQNISMALFADKVSIGKFKALALLTAKPAGAIFKEAVELLLLEYEIKAGREIVPVSHDTALPRKKEQSTTLFHLVDIESF